MAEKAEKKNLKEYENEIYYLLWWLDKRHFRIASVSRTKMTRSHGLITLWNWMFSTVLHLLVYSLTRRRNFARKEELIYETIAALTSNAGHLGWQHMRSFTKWHDHSLDTPWSLGRTWYFVPFFVFYTESIMLGLRFITESGYYTQSVMLSLRFIPSP